MLDFYGGQEITLTKEDHHQTDGLLLELLHKAIQGLGVEDGMNFFLLWNRNRLE